MQYVNLGKTGLKVSRLCLGMMSYGSKQWRTWILEEEESKPFIKRALDAMVKQIIEIQGVLASIREFFRRIKL